MSSRPASRSSVMRRAHSMTLRSASRLSRPSTAIVKRSSRSAVSARNWNMPTARRVWPRSRIRFASSRYDSMRSGNSAMPLRYASAASSRMPASVSTPASNSRLTLSTSRSRSCSSTSRASSARPRSSWLIASWRRYSPLPSWSTSIIDRIVFS